MTDVIVCKSCGKCHPYPHCESGLMSSTPLREAAEKHALRNGCYECSAESHFEAGAKWALEEAAKRCEQMGEYELEHDPAATTSYAYTAQRLGEDAPRAIRELLNGDSKP